MSNGPLGTDRDISHLEALLQKQLAPLDVAPADDSPIPDTPIPEIRFSIKPGTWIQGHDSDSDGSAEAQSVARDEDEQQADKQLGHPTLSP
ncbi:hypothetical protein TWF696_005502 [Orbilia brochopaga]|uniref:Uncharacterized protein n=1 Tax=Orbilia brochopaga TaxID=3140254 RepID=A0AAV9V288_9PEZI